MSEGHVISINANKITTIEFFHPAQNSLPGDLLSQLVDKIEEAGKDENTSIIILKSTGERTFCAGASFKELVSIQDFESSKKFTEAQLKADIINVKLTVESAENIKEIKSLKKLTGYKHYYRIRVGVYRIGVKINGDLVVFVDIDHRSNIYRNFP